MMVRTVVIVLLALTAGFAALMVTQQRIDSVRRANLDDELLYIPNEKLLSHFTAGMDSVIADVLWLRCIQYAVKEFHNVERKYTWLESMCDIITELDPHFVGAYQYSGTLLAALSNDDMALKLLRKGMVENPSSPELPFEAAKIYILNRREEPEAPALASHYLTMAAARSDRPKFYTDWAYNIQVSRDLKVVGRELWEDQLKNSTNKFIREVAKTKIQELDLRLAVDHLNELADELRQRTGRAIRSPEDLVKAGLIEALPTDPFGGHYLVDSKGVIQNTTLLDDLKERYLMHLRTSIKVFKQEEGRWPRSLDELREYRNLQELFPHPYEGQQWQYDPATGEIH